ncbi:unnamed protein product [Orchesella dallaii]|uniref:Uncharacterized protein n=1 Tax=Orchesella dallaii TaxID=48710 RepID=A0ABP1QLP0_9HEXA
MCATESKIALKPSLDALAKCNHKFDQLTGILRKKIAWNKTFSVISTMEGQLHARVNDFRKKQAHYQSTKIDLLDGMSSKDLQLNFSLAEEIDSKYEILNEIANKFKTKLNNASEESKEERKVWLDDGFIVPELTVFMKLSEKSRNAMVKKCREGDWVAERIKIMFTALTFEWSKLEGDLGDRVKDCTQSMENLLWEKLLFTGVNSCSRMSDAWKNRVTKNLRKRALQTMIKKPDTSSGASPSSSRQKKSS